MRADTDEILRFLGVGEPVPEQLRRQAEEEAGALSAAAPPRYVYRVYPLEREGEDFCLAGSGVTLGGRTARLMLSGCTRAALLCCTLGAGFEALLRARQVRDMARAVILDAAGSALVEAGCDAAQEELARRAEGQYLTDRFSPGYGDLPLSLQPAVCAALDAGRRLGVQVTDSLLLNPSKTVTAVIGLSARPQMARVRGCDFCALRESCQLRKGGRRCGL
ncbi:MAG: methionine synthase [Lawsonibacter sp.]|nr:methionine synthase [Lawsonibacter sp.]